MPSCEQGISTTTSPIHHSRKAAFIESPAPVNQAPWTAARCQRLLRPLSSKIAHLRKLKGLETLRGSADRELDGEQNRIVVIDSRRKGYNEHLQSNQPICPKSEEWECSPRPQKRIKRTYSSRTKVQMAGVDEGIRMIPSSSVMSGESLRMVQCQLSMPSLDNESQTQDPGLCVKNTVQPPLVDVPKAVRKEIKRARCQPGTLATSDYSRLQIQYLMQGRSKELAKLYDAIYLSLSTILKTTHHSQGADRKGCPSLFSTCLKTVPDYIQEEDYWARVENPIVHPDISSTIYSELESTTAGLGWRPLRKIVRAHAIMILRTAIKDGLISVSIANVLLEFCIGEGAYDDAQEILESMTSFMFSREIHSTDEATLNDHCTIFKGVQLFSEIAGKHGFLYRHLAAIMVSALPWTYLSSSLYNSLSGAVQSVAKGDEHARDAANLIRSLVRPSDVTLVPTTPTQIQEMRLANVSKQKRNVQRRASSRGDGVTNSIKSDSSYSKTIDGSQESTKSLPVKVADLLAVLSAVSIVQQENYKADSTLNCSPTAILLREIAQEAHQSIEIALNIAGSPEYLRNKRTLILPLIADAVVGMMCDETVSRYSWVSSLNLDAISALSLDDNVVSEAGSFICMIAQFYAQARASSGFEFIKRVVEKQRIAAKSTSWAKATQSFLNSLIMATALAFSQNTSQPCHLDWALSVEQIIGVRNEATPRSTVDRTPARAIYQARNGYKWEDGICEWIAKTPAIDMHAPGTPSSTGTSTDNDHALAIGTPTTCPETDSAPAFLFSPCLIRKEKAHVITSRHKQGCASLQCVRIMVGRGQTLNEQRPSSLGRLSQDSEARRSELEVFQSHGEYDDADELCTAQHVRELSLPRLRKYPHVARSGMSCRGEVHFCKTIRSNRQIPNRRLNNWNDLDEQDSETEDELSLS